MAGTKTGLIYAQMSSQNMVRFLGPNIPYTTVMADVKPRSHFELINTDDVLRLHCNYMNVAMTSRRANFVIICTSYMDSFT